MRPDILERAFDTDHFKQQGVALLNILSDYFTAARANEIKANNYKSPEESLEFWKKQLKQEPFDFTTFLNDAIDQSMHLHHPRYVGHQVGVSLPSAALMGLLANVLNNGMAIYEVGQVAAPMEQVVVQSVAAQLGYGEAADGVLTSGGTLGNLTALLTARAVKAPTEVWKNGTQDQLAVMVSEEAHYCVDRAVKIMGWGEAGIIKVPTDEQFRMKIDLLETLYQKAIEQGIKVVAVVGSACTTSTGTYDNLDGIADFCQQHHLWFHVDGAHGAAAAFSARHQHLVEGMARADSIVMDFHKMLLTPALTTGVFYKEGKQSYKTFHQKAHYLWNNQDDTEWYNLGKRTFECTKLMMAARVYIQIKEYGFELWSTYVQRMFDLGKSFADLIKQAPNFELAVEPDCNIVCFRYVPFNDETDLSIVNEQIRQILYEKGDFYFVQTKLRGQTYLRTTLMNPFTTLSDLRELIKEIEATAMSIAPLEVQ